MSGEVSPRRSRRAGEILLAAAALTWPVLLAAAVWVRQDGHAPAWTTVVYAFCSRICHQRPDRSFFSGGVQWPVCGRCAGLYLAAPVGAILALRGRQRVFNSTRAR